MPADDAAEWVEIIPDDRRNSAGFHGVSLSLRTQGKRHGRQLVVGIGARLAEELDWPSEGRVSAAISAGSRLLRLRPAERGWRLGKKSRGKQVALTVPGLSGGEPRLAEIATHRVEGGALLIVLPDWAVPGDVPILPRGGASTAAQSAGGAARAEALSPERRAEITRIAAAARWGGNARAGDAGGGDTYFEKPAAREPDRAASPGDERWTPERYALLHELWPRIEAVPNPELVRRINALPGPAISGWLSFSKAAEKMDLPARRMAAADEAKEAARLAPPPPVGPRTLEDDRREVERLLAQGMAGRDIASDLGLPPSVVAEWATAWREARKRGAA